MSLAPQSARSPWPHRWAVVLACATFPLVWVGGLVTTTNSGMAVPDWPSTFGYNLFLYPWESWLRGPFGIFIEHGHRLLASSVGLLAIALAASLWRSEERGWVRWTGAAALGLVVFQGVLGGMRVILNEQTLAMLHGCIGPLFFALAVAISIFTSRRWLKGDARVAHPHAAQVRWLAIVTCVLLYLQLVFGAVLRHVPVTSEPAAFMLAVRFHLFLAAVLLLHVTSLSWLVLRYFRQVRWLTQTTLALSVLLGIQLLLGAATWIAKFSVPTWAAGMFPPDFTVQAEGFLQTHVVTAHVAIGSLLLATSVIVALAAWRSLATPATIARAANGRLGATR